MVVVEIGLVTGLLQRLIFLKKKLSHGEKKHLERRGDKEKMRDEGKKMLVPSAECRVPSAECRVPSAECRVTSDE